MFHHHLFTDAVCAHRAVCSGAVLVVVDSSRPPLAGTGIRPLVDHHARGSRWESVRSAWLHRGESCLVYNERARPRTGEPVSIYDFIEYIDSRNSEAAFSLSTCWRVASHSPPSRSRPSRGFCTRRAAKMDLVEFTHAVRCSFDPLSEPHLRGMAAASLDQLKRSDQV